MRQVLVVANQTLSGQPLLDVLREKLASEPLNVWVVVPATPPPTDATVVAPTAGGLVVGTNEPAPGYQAAELAERRLEEGLELIRGLGCEADGEIGDPNPMTAVDEALARQTFDEIVISTLPTNLSHWLRLDLPARVERKHHLPVTTVTPAG